jgi:hypothetical protein
LVSISPRQGVKLLRSVELHVCPDGHLLSIKYPATKDPAPGVCIYPDALIVIVLPVIVKVLWHTNPDIPQEIEVSLAAWLDVWIGPRGVCEKVVIPEKVIIPEKVCVPVLVANPEVSLVAFAKVFSSFKSFEICRKLVLIEVYSSSYFPPDNEY